MWKFKEKESKEEVAATAEKVPHISINIYFRDERRLSSFSCKIEEDTARGAFNLKTTYASAESLNLDAGTYSDTIVVTLTAN